MFLPAATLRRPGSVFVTEQLVALSHRTSQLQQPRQREKSGGVAATVGSASLVACVRSLFQELVSAVSDVDGFVVCRNLFIE